MKPWIRRSLAGLFAILTLGALSGCGHYRGQAGWVASPEEQARHREHFVDRVASRDRQRVGAVLPVGLPDSASAALGHGLADDDIRVGFACPDIEAIKSQVIET